MSNNEIKNPKIGGVRVAELPKEHVPLPHLHFVAAMDWIDKLGETAFCAYLKLFTMADRKGKSLKSDEAKIKDSLRNVQKDLGVANATFYNKIIKPLWNHNLIDLEVYEDSKLKKNAQKPINIIVYPYPNMEYERMVLKLEKLRDYDKDYNSEAKINANKKVKKSAGDPVQKMNGIETGISDENLDLDTVQKMNGGPFKNKTGARSKNEQNNLRSNSINNGFNSFNNREEEEEGVSELLHNPSFQNLKTLAINFGFDDNDSAKLLKLVIGKNIQNLNDEIVLEAFDEVAAEVSSGKNIYDLVIWTAGKIERVAKRKALKPRNIRSAEVPKKAMKLSRKENKPGWYAEHEEKANQKEQERLTQEQQEEQALVSLRTIYESQFGEIKGLAYYNWQNEQCEKYNLEKSDYVGLNNALLSDQKIEAGAV